MQSKIRKAGISDASDASAETFYIPTRRKSFRSGVTRVTRVTRRPKMDPSTPFNDGVTGCFYVIQKNIKKESLGDSE